MTELILSPQSRYWVLEAGRNPFGAGNTEVDLTNPGSANHNCYSQSASTDTTSKPESGWWESQMLLLFEANNLPAGATINSAILRVVVESVIRHQDDDTAYLHAYYWTGETFPPVDDLATINGASWGDANGETNILAVDPLTLDQIISEMPNIGPATVNQGWSDPDDYDISIGDLSGIVGGQCTIGLVLSNVTAYPDTLDSDTFANAGVDPSQRFQISEPRLVIDYTEPADGGTGAPAEELPVDEQVTPARAPESEEDPATPSLAEELLAVRRYPGSEFAARIRRAGLRRRRL